ncbi:hypothetical protein BJ546DRAFT_321108 [Cryomyces antarcticus]
MLPQRRSSLPGSRARLMLIPLPCRPSASCRTALRLYLGALYYTYFIYYAVLIDVQNGSELFGLRLNRWSSRDGALRYIARLLWAERLDRCRNLNQSINQSINQSHGSHRCGFPAHAGEPRLVADLRNSSSNVCSVVSRGAATAPGALVAFSSEDRTLPQCCTPKTWGSWEKQPCAGMPPWATARWQRLPCFVARVLCSDYGSVWVSYGRARSGSGASFGDGEAFTPAQRRGSVKLAPTGFAALNCSRSMADLDDVPVCSSAVASVEMYPAGVLQHPTLWIAELLAVSALDSCFLRAFPVNT